MKKLKDFMGCYVEKIFSARKNFAILDRSAGE